VSVLWELKTVKGLKAGRSSAKDRAPVRGVTDEQINAIKPFVTAPVWAMVQLQRLSGMRPGEVLIMRSRDILQLPEYWEYTPRSHKTEHHDRARVVIIGPRARAILGPLLKRKQPDEFLFSPRDVRGMTDDCERQPGERYDRDAYRTAIQRGCERAYGMPAELRNPNRGLSKLMPAERDAERKRRLVSARAWRQTHCWFPHQLRHAFATALRSVAGIEAARVALGHASVSTSELYAERDIALASKHVSQIG
jgi:integrase